MSIKDIADAMGATSSHIELVIQKRAVLTPDHVNAYLKFADKHFWEFALAAIPLSHLPEKAKKRVLLCKQIDEVVNKKRKNS